MTIIKYLVDQPINVLLGIAGIGLVIAIHEFGHFLFCKLFKIRTPSFSIGFGPKIFQKKIGETIFSISIIPLGGYVEIAGNEEIGQGEQKHAKDKDQYSFAVKPFYQKAIVMLGGISFNMLFSYAVFTILFLIGAPGTPFLPPIRKTTIIEHIEKSLKKTKLKVNDQIIAVNNINVLNQPEKLIHIIRPLADKKIKLTIKRDNKEKDINIRLGHFENNGEKLGTLSINFKILSHPKYRLIPSLKLAWDAMLSNVSGGIQALKSIFFKGEIKNIAGPTLIIYSLINGAAKGLKFLFAFLSFISVNLAILNLIPLPITDGGQIVILTFETIFNRSLSDKIKEYIYTFSWLLMLLLIISVTFKDLNFLYKLFKN